MSENNNSQGGDDRRLSKRYDANHPAVLKIEGLSAFDCEIRDFCESGFYLSAAENNSLQNLLPIVQPNTSLVVEFDGGPKSYAIEGNVARLSSDGLGIYCPDMPNSAYRALFAGKFKSGGNPNDIDQISGSPQLISQCRESLFDFANTFVPEFYDKAEEDLTQALDTASFSQRSEFQQALNAFKADPTRAQSGFMADVRECVEAFENDAPLPIEAPGASDELSLVDMRGFEEWLAVSSIAYRIEGVLRQEMTQFELRYARLSGTLVDRKTSPYGAETICRLFDAQLRKMDLSDAAEEIVHKTLFSQLKDALTALYEVLTEIVSSVDPINKVSKSSSDSSAPSNQVDEVEQDDSNQEDSGQDGSGQDGTGQSEAHVSDSDAGQQHEAHQGGDANRASSPQSAMTPGDTSATESIANNTSANDTSMNASQVPRVQKEYSFENLFKAIQRSSESSDERIETGAPRRSAAASYFGAGQGQQPVARQGADGGGVAPGGSPEAGAPSRGSSGGGQGIARALAGMRGASGEGRAKRAAASKRATFAPKVETAKVVSLLDQIESKSRNAGDGGSTLPLSSRLSSKLDERELAGIDQEDREQLNTVADIVDKAVSEYQPTCQIEALVVALEKPLLKLVLVDAEFLSDESHPARRFMNTLDQFAIAADDDGNFYDPKLYEFLDSVIATIVAEPVVGREVFEVCLEKISDMLLRLQQLRLRRVSLLQESSEARERVRTARGITATSLDEFLAGQEVPVTALDLLDIGWRHHMNLLELRETRSSEVWLEAFEIFKRICGWLSPEKLPEYLDEDGEPDEDALDMLLHEVELGLAHVSTDTDGVESFIAAMKAEIVASRAYSPETSTHVLAVEEANKEGDSTNFGIARIGEWWSVPTSGKKVIAQLIWKNREENKYAATNRSASRRWELNAGQFEKDISNGKITRIGEGQFLLFDRSEGALFDDLYKRLASQIVEEETIGVVNRKGFLKKLDLACLEKDNTHSLVQLEFDQFRVISHNWGMDACEELSNKLISEIQELLAPSDVISSFTQDLIMILMQNCDLAMAEKKTEAILSKMKDYKHSIDSETYRLGLNIGVAECSSGKEAADIALRQADSACMASKDVSRNHIQVYDVGNKQLKVRDSVMELAGRIDRIIAGGGLYLRAQMVMPVGDGTEAGLAPYHEILLGINDEKGLRVVPEKFIQAVEKLRRTDELDLWVLNKVFEWIHTNPEKYREWGGFSINLSGSSLASAEVLEYLLKTIPTIGDLAEKLIFEITETAAIENYDSAKDFLWEVRRLGCRFSLDDFGTGYASYSHLRKLRPDILKIDGSFIWNLATDNSDFVLVKSMNDIGKALGFSTVAEYVESPAILAKLGEIGVDYAQGYAIHRPEPLEDMLKRFQ